MFDRIKFLILASFFLGIFFFSVKPLNDYDIWFHIKSGEIIAQQGIIHHDVFSFNTKGREWFPYEWLFQVSMYKAKEVFGIESIRYITAAAITVWMGVMFLILHIALRSPLFFSLALTFFYYVSIYEFFSARPHVFAYTFLTIHLLLILLYVVRRKNFLWITIPITLLWTNTHGSVFLGFFLFFAYAVVQFLQKNKKQTITLLLWGIGTLILTILPPLGTLQYRLLWIFFQKNSFISTFIEDWTPLVANRDGFIFFSTTLGIAIGLFALRFWKTKEKSSLILLIPLVPFIPMAYMASRNIVLGYTAATIWLGWSLWKNRITMVITLGILLLFVWVLSQKRIEPKFYYPGNAVNFIQQTYLKGHMFNEYGYGGYLLYHLYPDQQVFFDGRTDLYLCCEMPDTLKLAKQKKDSDEEFGKLLDWLWNKYDISFVLMRTEKHSILRKIARILTNNPSWSLVFWDDHSQIFLRHDGKNDAILERFAATAATPYEKDPFVEGKEGIAMEEYKQMITFADSARSRNAIGFLLLKQNKLDEAKIEFEKAIALDPTFESPYMNIGELALAAGDLNTAIYLYQEALKRAADRGLIYIRLGTLYRQAGQPGTARRVFENGVKQTVDTDAKKQLLQLLDDI